MGLRVAEIDNCTIYPWEGLMESSMTNVGEAKRNTRVIPLKCNTDGIIRTTILIPATIDQNWEICGIKLGLSKNEVVKRALSEFLRTHGFDPNRTPKSLEVTY